MPKSKVVWDVPLWDGVVAELGDPRPYVPTEFTPSFVPDDEPFIDPDYFDDLLYELVTEAEDGMSAVDGWREEAIEALDQIHVVPPALVEWYNSTEVTTQFAAVGALSNET